MPTSGFYSCTSRVTILFVDNDAGTRLAYQSLATDEGFGVELAADAHEATALARVLLPDVIVLEVRLPDLEGLAVVRRLRASARTCAIPIVIVTGDDTEEVDVAVRASGCEGHLVRPCSAGEFVRLVNVLAIRGRDDVPEMGLRVGA